MTVPHRTATPQYVPQLRLTLPKADCPLQNYPSKTEKVPVQQRGAACEQLRVASGTGAGEHRRGSPDGRGACAARPDGRDETMAGFNLMMTGQRRGAVPSPLLSPPPFCESNTQNRARAGVVSATVGTMSYFALYKFLFCSEHSGCCFCQILGL